MPLGSKANRPGTMDDRRRRGSMTTSRSPNPPAGLPEGKPLRGAVSVRLREALSADPRASAAELARHVGMSAPAVRERLARREETGVIRGYRLDLDPAALGL